MIYANEFCESSITFDVDALLAGAWVGVEVHLHADLPHATLVQGSWGLSRQDTEQAHHRGRLAERL